MKRKLQSCFYLLSIITCLLLVQEVSCQTILKDNYMLNDGTEWYYEIEEGDYTPGIPVKYYYSRMAIDGDTIIQGKPCKILNEYNDDFMLHGSTASKEYLYQEGSKVYWFNTYLKHFNLLYDFDAEPGATWDIYIYDCEMTLTVESVDYSYYNDVLRKNLYVKISVPDMNRFYFSGKVIEGIGSTKTLLPSFYWFECENQYFICGLVYNGIRCFESQDEYINFMDYPCDTIYQKFYNGIDNNLLQTTNFIVTPNPSSTYIRIDLDIKADYAKSFEVEVYNLLGEIVLFDKDYILGSSIDISSLSRGVYIIAITNDQTIYKTKLLKH